MKMAAAALVLAFGAGGCIARVTETRVESAVPVEPEGSGTTTVEKRAIEGGEEECRDVAVTGPRTREVEVHRSFADDAQSRNATMAILLGTGVGLLAYGQDQVSCPQSGGGCSAPTFAALGLLGLAAIPLGYLAYNQLSIGDRRIVEPVPPQTAYGPWRSCSQGTSTAR